MLIPTQVILSKSKVMLVKNKQKKVVKILLLLRSRELAI